MKKVLSILSVALLTMSAFAQRPSITLKNYFNDAEFFLVAEEYVDALTDYQEVYKRGYQENANINYRIGICYINIPGSKEKAIEYFNKAKQKASRKYTASTLKEEYAPLDVYLYLGNAYRVLNQLDSAISVYSKYKTLLDDTEKEELNYVNKQLEACYIANEFISNPVNVAFNNVGRPVNNSNANRNAVLSGDGNTMIFMSKLPFYDAVYMSKRSGDKWARPVNITPQIMSDGDQQVLYISNDGKTLLLAKEDEFNSDIFISHFEDGQWTPSESVSKVINTRYWESSASLSADGKTLYFSSNSRGGIGEMDIYYSKNTALGWGDPVNIGNVINTELNEENPFVTADGKFLFFSSQGHRSMGGYDVFVSEFTDSSWSLPKNLKYPISTTDDDLFYFPINQEEGYTHRMFEDGYGSWDIYKVVIGGDEPVVPEAPIAEVEEPTSPEIVETDTPEETTKDDAIQEEVVSPEEEIVEETATETEILEIELKPLLFPFDAFVLTAEAKAELDKLIGYLNNNANLKATIIGHTDALGPDDYNQRLSEQRAKTVRSYLVSKGIAENTLIVKGMGEQQFVARNTKPDGSDDPESRKYNRRVEFELNGLDASKMIIKKISLVPEHYKIQQK